jgi:hypothetical protein
MNVVYKPRHRSTFRPAPILQKAAVDHRRIRNVELTLVAGVAVILLGAGIVIFAAVIL